MLAELSMEQKPPVPRLGESPTLVHRVNRSAAYNAAPSTETEAPHTAPREACSEDAPAAAAVGEAATAAAALEGGAEGTRDASTPAPNQSLAEAYVVRDFLERHCSQLTPAGAHLRGGVVVVGWVVKQWWGWGWGGWWWWWWCTHPL